MRIENSPNSNWLISNFDGALWVWNLALALPMPIGCESREFKSVWLQANSN